MSAIFNIGSLLLGVFAWILAGIAIKCEKKNTVYGFSVASFISCTISLWSQILEVGNRVKLNDFSAIADTIRAVIIASSVLICVTIILNIIALIKQKGK